MGNYSPNNAHSSHWQLCLSQIDTEGKINDRWRSCEHKFGIENISFKTIKVTPPIKITPFDGVTLMGVPDAIQP